MGQATAYPRLTKRGHTFYCRPAVPVAARKAVGKCELWKSLGSDYNLALRKLASAAAEHDRFIMGSRKAPTG